MEPTMLTKTQFTSRFGQTINLEQAKDDKPETALYKEMVVALPTVDLNKDSKIDFDEYTKSRIDLMPRLEYVDGVLSQGVMSGKIDLVRYALSESADPNMLINEVPVIIVSTHMGFHEIVEELIKHGADINATDQRKEYKLLTPLMWSVMEKRIECTKVLLNNNVDTEVKAKHGITALMFAVREGGDIDILKLLLDKGANVEAKDENGMSPLLGAIINRNLEAVKLLIAKGADVKVTDKNGKGVMYYANTIPNLQLKENMLKLIKDSSALSEKK